MARWKAERDSTPWRVVGLHLISPQESVTGRLDPTGISKEIDIEIHDPEKSPASDKLTEGRGSADPDSNGRAETTTGGIVERRIMDAAGVQVQVSQVLVKCNRTSFYSAPQCSHCKSCTSYDNSICLSVCQSVTYRYCVKTTARRTVQFALSDSKICLVL